MREGRFRLHEATIDEIHFAPRFSTISCRRLVEMPRTWLPPEWARTPAARFACRLGSFRSTSRTN